MYLIKDILAILFVSLIFASALDPSVDWMQRKKIPRGLGVILIYLIFFSVLGLLLYLIIPPVAEQISGLSENFPAYLDKVISGYTSLREYSLQHGFLDNLKNTLYSISTNMQSAAGSVFSTVIGFFGGIFSFFLVLVITFYMTVEENAIKKLVWSLAPTKHQPYIMQLINRMQRKIGLWLRGQLILDLIIFLMSFIVLFSLNIKYALVLALFAGVMETIPYLGPILGSIPAVFIAFTMSPILGLIIGLLFYLIQLLENNILVPKVMEKAVGLNPIVSISALLIGFQLAGIVGALLAMPVATALSVIVKDIFEGIELSRMNNEE